MKMVFNMMECLLTVKIGCNYTFKGNRKNGKDNDGVWRQNPKE
jgi:hypothetical protein